MATIDLINAYTSTNISTSEVEGGKVDMCKAIDEMIEEGRIEGRKEGREDVMAEIKQLRASGLSADQILKKIEQNANRKPRARKKSKDN